MEDKTEVNTSKSEDKDRDVDALECTEAPTIPLRRALSKTSALQSRIEIMLMLIMLSKETHKGKSTSTIYKTKPLNGRTEDRSAGTRVMLPPTERQLPSTALSTSTNPSTPASQKRSKSK